MNVWVFIGWKDQTKRILILKKKKEVTNRDRDWYHFGWLSLIKIDINWKPYNNEACVNSTLKGCKWLS